MGSVRAGKDEEDMPLRYNLRKLKKRRDKVSSKYSRRAFERGGGSHGVVGYKMDGLRTFCHKNDIVGIFRGHEQKNLGPDFSRYGPRYAFPASTTVFSAPNYTDKSANIGCIVVFENGAAEFVTYSWRLHPQYASFLDAVNKKKDKKKKKKKKKKSKSKTYGHEAGERLWEVEDIVMYANYIDPDTLRVVTVGHIVEEYEQMLNSSVALRGVEDFDSEARGWEYIRTNITTLLKQSKSPKIVDRLKKKTELLRSWYSHVDMFQEGVEAEEEYEKNVFSDKAPTYNDSFKNNKNNKNRNKNKNKKK